MKKMLVLIVALTFLQISPASAQPPEQAKQLTKIFNALGTLKAATVSQDWDLAQKRLTNIQQLLSDTAPSVRRVIGNHTYKALSGFVWQLKTALQARDRQAVTGSLSSLEKMHDWLSRQYTAGI